MVKKIWEKRLILFLLSLVIMAACLLAGCDGKKDEPILSLEQLNEPGRRIGVPEDTADDKLAAKLFPQAEIVYTQGDMTGYTSVLDKLLYCFKKCP